MKHTSRDLAALFMASDASQKFRSALEFGAVIAIIMVLVSLAARSFDTFIVQSQMTEAFSLTTLVRADLVAHRAEHGQWPSTAPELHNSTLDEEFEVGTVVDHLELGDGGALTVVFDSTDSAAELQGRKLTLRPMFVAAEPGSPVSWVCAAHNVPDGLTAAGTDETNIDTFLLPSACRDY